MTSGFTHVSRKYVARSLCAEQHQAPFEIFTWCVRHK